TSPKLGEEFYLPSYQRVRRGLRGGKIYKNTLFKGLPSASQPAISSTFKSFTGGYCCQAAIVGEEKSQACSRQTSPLRLE
ncbi:hypothetical protein, partial [Flexistipes sp.]|uniref:hypothetical protein n=1 Tax=Flexistipes sp. TaxID=3088135 RepID=UPI002E243BD2|nr:hypothetical protein [Flexistipes sp.]